MIEYEHMYQLKNTIDSLYPLGKECWTEIETSVYYKKLNKKEYFSREDQFIKELGFACKGIMRLFYLSENGGEHNKHFFIENDFVAASIDPDKKSISSIQALASVTLICISYPKCLELIDRFNQFNRFIQKLTLDCLSQKQQKEMQFLSNTAVDNYKYFKKKFPDLENKISHYHVASYLGITPTQLSRIRKCTK
ncbi:MAG: Crp/Fnr family transcriptional regulator [Nitrospirae bacterium]|nr:Crp/Fnr family transcriptional regulator [Nitrospirota bacterium]